MAYIIFAVFLVAILFIVLGVKLSKPEEDSYKNVNITWKVNKRQIFAPLGFAVILFGTFTNVGANTVGIVFDPFNGGIQEETLTEGFNSKSIFSSVYKLSTSTQTVDYEITAQAGIIWAETDSTKCTDIAEGETVGKYKLNAGTCYENTGGGQYVTYQVSLSYRIEAVNAGNFYKEFGVTEVPSSFLNSKTREAIQSNSTKYDVYSILQGSVNNVRSETFDELFDTLSSHAITLTSFVIDDVDAGASIEAIVVAEAEAAKQEEIKLKEQAAQKIQLEMELAQAENDAQIELILAQGKADAESLLASITVNTIQTMYISQFNGDSTAQSDFEASIDPTTGVGEGGYLTIQEVSDIVIQQLYYDTWDGVLPEVIVGSDGEVGIILPA